MKLNKTLLLLGFLPFSLVSCQKGEEVSEAEWKDAIENIINYKDTKTLNYKTTGEIKEALDDDVTIYKDLEVNNNLEKICRKDDEGEVTEYMYEVKKGRHFVKIYKNDENFDYSFEVEPNRNMYDKYLDLYDHKNDFKFVNHHYVYKSEQTESFHHNIDLVFINKKISQITLDYYEKENNELYTISGTCNFTYGNSSLTESEEILGPDYKTKIDNEYSLRLCELKETKYKSDVDSEDDIYIVIKAGSNVGNRRKITTDQRCCCHKDEVHRVYKNGVLLTFGENEGEGDFWLADPYETTSYASLVLKDKLNEGDVLEVDLETNYWTTFEVEFNVIS